MAFAHLIIRNLFRHGRRTILTIISISISIVLFVDFAALQNTTTGILDAAAKSPRLVCHNIGGLAYFLPKAYKQKLVALPHVQAVAAWSYFGGVYRTPNDQITAFASDPENLAKLFPDWGITAEMAQQFLLTKTAAIVSSDLMLRYGWKVGQTVMLRSTITALYRQPLTFTITDALPATGPSQLFIFRDDYLENVNERVPPVSYFWILLDRMENAPAVIEEIDAMFHNSANGTQTETEKSYVGGLLRQWGSILLIVEVVSIVSLITIALVAANTAAMSIRERRREIAVMRAIGFDSRHIVIFLVGESWLIGLLAGAIGCVIGSIALGSMARVLPISEIDPRVSFWVVAESLAVASLIGIVSGLFPTLAAVRRTIVDGLRSF